MFTRLTQQEGDARVGVYVNTDNITTMRRHTDHDGSAYSLITFTGGMSVCVDEEPDEIVERIERRREHDLNILRPRSERE